MSFPKTILAATIACVVALPAIAQDITIKGAYARASGMMAKSGAAFFVIVNEGDQDDTLVSATSDISNRVETHTHIKGENDMIMMRKVEGGFPVAAHSERVLTTSGDHLMFMGLLKPMKQGDTISVTMMFEKAGEMTIEIPVDLKRKPSAMMKHGEHSMPQGN